MSAVSRAMRVAFVTPEYATAENPGGGLANYVRMTALLLARRGVDVRIFAASRRNALWRDDGVTVCEVRRGNALTDRLFRSRADRSLAHLAEQYVTARKVARAVLRAHREASIDIIQAPSYKALGYVLLRNGAIPLVCRISSYTPLVRSAYGRRRNFFEYLSDWLEVRQVLDAEACFAPSRFAARHYERLETAAPRIIRTPVDGLDAKPDVSYFEAHRPPARYLFFLGTLSRIKGADLLAEAIPGILGRHPDLGVVFIGRDDGIPGIGSAFDYIASRCGAGADRLHRHPELPKAQVLPFLRGAVALLLPSRVDNYPNVCLEAHAAGRPVIGTTDSSLEEMIEDGRTGFLAKNGEAGSLGAAIARCLAMTPDEAAAMTRNISAQMALVAREDRVGQLLAFYEEVLAAFRRSHG